MFNNGVLQVENVSSVTAVNSVSIGEMVWNNGNEYIYCYNGGGEARQGAVVVLSGVSSYTFVATAATGADTTLQAFGVVKNATVATANYAWICTRGFVSVNNAANGPAVVTGDHIIIDSTGYCRRATYTSSLTQIVAQGVIGKALNSAASNASIPVYICLG